MNADRTDKQEGSPRGRNKTLQETAQLQGGVDRDRLLRRVRGRRTLRPRVSSPAQRAFSAGGRDAGRTRREGRPGSGRSESIPLPGTRGYGRPGALWAAL